MSTFLSTLSEPTMLFSVVLVAGTVMFIALISHFLRPYYLTASSNYFKGASNSDGAVLKNTSSSETAAAAAAEAVIKTKESKTEHKNNSTCGAVTEEKKKCIEPTSVLRGFPQVDSIIVSPCQRFLFINCRSKRRARLYPQNRNRSFMARGKELKEKYFVSVDDAVKSAMNDDDAKVEVYSVAFSYDGERFAVSERNSDTFFIFSINSKCQLTVQSSCKLPHRRLVSSLPPWGLAGVAYDLIVMMYDKDCELELFSLQSKEFFGKTKFKVGNALAWAQRSNTISVAGSFLKEPRVATLQPRSNGNTFQLLNSVHVEEEVKVRVSALCLTSKNVPAFNTREYLIFFTEEGKGFIYDIEVQSINSKTERSLSLVGQFHDSKFAGWDAASRVNMTCCIYGTAHHERLSIALYRGADVTVFRQTTTHGSSGELFSLESVMVLHDCHEGDRVNQAVFIQNGEGLATSGFVDGGNVRLWTLPPLPNS